MREEEGAGQREKMSFHQGQRAKQDTCVTEEHIAT